MYRIGKSIQWIHYGVRIIEKREQGLLVWDQNPETQEIVTHDCK